MRVLLQRVTAGSVQVSDKIVGQIGPGLVLLVGAGHDDDTAIAHKLAEKVANLRIFNDDDGKFNRSLVDVDGEVLVVSQFTLYADAKRGRRPSFVEAAAPEHASNLIDSFAERLRQIGIRKVETGCFGAMMHVEIHNDGPVTIWLDSDELKR